MIMHKNKLRIYCSYVIEQHINAYFEEKSREITMITGHWKQLKIINSSVLEVLSMLTLLQTHFKEHSYNIFAVGFVYFYYFFKYNCDETKEKKISFKCLFFYREIHYYLQSQISEYFKTFMKGVPYKITK